MEEKEEVRAAEAFTHTFRGQCSQRGCGSRTGRFSQLQAEPEVRSCDSGLQPAPRQISFVQQRKTLPCVISGNFSEVYDPHGLATSKIKGTSFSTFHPALGTWPLWESIRRVAFDRIKNWYWNMWMSHGQDLLGHRGVYQGQGLIFKNRKWKKDSLKIT